jgi:hypothetical protein
MMTLFHQAKKAVEEVKAELLTKLIDDEQTLIQIAENTSIVMVAVEMRLTAERRLGELLFEHSFEPKFLRAQGISKPDEKRAKRFAAMAEAEFKAEVLLHQARALITWTKVREK